MQAVLTRIQYLMYLGCNKLIRFMNTFYLIIMYHINILNSKLSFNLKKMNICPIFTRNTPYL